MPKINKLIFVLFWDISSVIVPYLSTVIGATPVDTWFVKDTYSGTQNSFRTFLIFFLSLLYLETTTIVAVIFAVP